MDLIEGQMSIFDYINIDNNQSEYLIDKPIRLIELFAGLGAQAKALKRLGAEFEHYKISEWEVHVCASYHKIHMKNDKTDYSKNYSDIELIEILNNIGISIDGKTPMSKSKIKSKSEKWHRRVYNNFCATHNIGSITNVKGADLEIIDKDNYFYLLTYSFPCQDISIAGKQKGFNKQDKTRSGLLWEVERLLLELKETDSLPQLLLLENVTQLHSKKFMPDFEKWQKVLEDLGYTNFWQDLNAKDYGIAQSRNRTFMISFLGKNIDFKFPEPIPLNKTMEDYLEDSVDSKYYIENDKSKQLIDKLIAEGILY